MGDRIDRCGPAFGRYTSPFVDRHPFTYPQRGLPYIEQASQDRVYEWARPIEDAPEAIAKLDDPVIRQEIEDFVDRFDVRFEVPGGPDRQSVRRARRRCPGPAADAARLSRSDLRAEGDPLSDDRMVAAEVRAALHDETLTHWSWFETGPVHADKAGIREDGDGWLVYSTDERAVEASRQHHDDESAALADFLHRARANTRYFRRRAERLRANAQQVSGEQAGARDESTGALER